MVTAPWVTNQFGILLLRIRVHANERVRVRGVQRRQIPERVIREVVDRDDLSVGVERLRERVDQFRVGKAVRRGGGGVPRVAVRIRLEIHVEAVEVVRHRRLDRCGNDSFIII